MEKEGHAHGRRNARDPGRERAQPSRPAHQGRSGRCGRDRRRIVGGRSDRCLEAVVRDAEAAPGRHADVRARVRSGSGGPVRHGARRGALGQGAHLRLAGGVRPGPEHQAGSRDVVEGGQERGHLHPPPGRAIPQRQGADGGRRRLLRHEYEESAAARIPDGRSERPGDDHGRSGPLEVSGAAGSVGAGRPDRRVLRLAALRAYRSRGALRPDQRGPSGDWHRPVQVGQLHPARPRRARPQRDVSGSPVSRT